MPEPRKPETEDVHTNSLYFFLCLGIVVNRYTHHLPTAPLPLMRFPPIIKVKVGIAPSLQPKTKY